MTSPAHRNRVAGAGHTTRPRDTDQLGLDPSVVAALHGSFSIVSDAELFGSPDIFGWYAIGLGIGFFGHLGLAWRLEGKKISGWMGVNGDAAPDEHWGRP